jgi:hypothetical protein
MGFSWFGRKAREQAHAAGVREGRLAQQKEEIARRDDFRRVELEMCIDTPLIIVPNEWDTTPSWGLASPSCRWDVPRFWLCTTTFPWRRRSVAVCVWISLISAWISACRWIRISCGRSLPTIPWGIPISTSQKVASVGARIASCKPWKPMDFSRAGRRSRLPATPSSYIRRIPGEPLAGRLVLAKTSFSMRAIISRVFCSRGSSRCLAVSRSNQPD